MTRLPVLLERSAQNDLDLIWEFVFEQDGLLRADSLVERLWMKCLRLSSLPGLGRPYPPRPGTRLLSAYKFAILYRVDSDAIRILHIVHGARDLESALDERTE